MVVVVVVLLLLLLLLLLVMIAMLVVVVLEPVLVVRHPSSGSEAFKNPGRPPGIMLYVGAFLICSFFVKICL